MQQIYPRAAGLSDEGLAALYAYPGPAAGASAPAGWLRSNMIASLDGSSTVDGRSGGLSGEADRQVFALLRALADVILVGAGTVRAEGYGPVRPDSEGTRWAWLRAARTPSPPVAVVTRRLDLDLDCPLLTEAPAHARTIVITTDAAPASRRAAAARTADVVVAGDASVDPPTAVAALVGRGYPRILAEGGPRLLSQIVGAGLLDELCLTISPLLAGPGTGRIVQPMGPAGMAGMAGPAALTLAHVVTDDGYLLCRYLRPSTSARSKLTGSAS